ncbi:MAG: NADP-dependent oxidoreductase [Microthrixaceae bacterium]|nr:NADP-dependent oxidoreductase [Microthrixaceae bacterium]MCO5318425.1 NADP-dependent oxidoreductase [Microthrixaceae bacterium]
MDAVNHQVVLRSRPQGLLTAVDVELVETPVPELDDGEALVRTELIGIDPAVRTWLDDQRGYLPPVQLGEVIRAATIGEVVSTRCDAYGVGDVVTSLGGFSNYSVARDDLFTTVVRRGSDHPEEVDREELLAVFGSTGATAYFGMHDIGRPGPGETVVVSAAAGATGSIAGQLAKHAGARVVGIAGSDEKCSVVTGEFGFDACINHRTDDLDAALREHCPGRVDVYFDNVGGPILDAVLGRLAMNARVVLCGVISSYVTGEHPGPANWVQLLARRARMEGFNTMDKWDRYEEATTELRRLCDAGAIHFRTHVFEGLDRAVAALNALFEGTNVGKTLLRP